MSRLKTSPDTSDRASNAAENAGRVFRARVPGACSGRVFWARVLGEGSRLVPECGEELERSRENGLARRSRNGNRRGGLSARNGSSTEPVINPSRPHGRRCELVNSGFRRSQTVQWWFAKNLANSCLVAATPATMSFESLTGEIIRQPLSTSISAC